LREKKGNFKIIKQLLLLSCLQSRKPHESFIKRPRKSSRKLAPAISAANLVLRVPGTICYASQKIGEVSAFRRDFRADFGRACTDFRNIHTYWRAPRKFIRGTSAECNAREFLVCIRASERIQPRQAVSPRVLYARVQLIVSGTIEMFDAQLQIIPMKSTSDFGIHLPSNVLSSIFFSFSFLLRFTHTPDSIVIKMR
jgi:hypothetical protein